MKNKTTYWMTLAVMTALAGARLSSAAEAEVKVHTDLPDATVKTDANRSDQEVGTRVDDAAAIRALGIKKPNKASGLLGMEVQNFQNQKLGEIKDLVLDVNSGKVSYAVLAVGGFLGIGEKLIAIPPSALTVSEDQGFLRLNADKTKIEAAPGFAATNWPRVGDPAITTHRFWTGDISAGAPAGAQIQSDSSTRIYTDANETKANAQVRANSDYKTIHGTVRMVDLKERKLLVDTDTGAKKVFHIDDNTVLGDNKAQSLRLDDLRQGAEINVQYSDILGRLKARSVETVNP